MYLKDMMTFPIYFFLVLGIGYIGLSSRLIDHGNFIFSLWVAAYCLISILIGCLAKDWKQMALWLLIAPDFALLVMVGVNDLTNYISGFYQYVLLLLFYSSFWVAGALLFDENQYKCATALVVAVLTSIMGGVAYVSFAPHSNTIGELSTDDIAKLAGILTAIYFIAEKWGKFVLEWRNLNRINKVDRSSVF